MKKILFIGPYQSGTGYGNSLLEYIYAAKEAGLDVVCRQCLMTNDFIDLPQEILELENKDLYNIDAVFQYNLPSEFQYKKGVLNIGGFAYETNGIPLNNWKFNIKNMDAIVHPYREQSNCYNFLCPGYVIPYSLDKNKFSKTYNKFLFPGNESCYKFYCISEINPRKNIPELLMTYFSHFSANDNVLLVLRCSVKGMSEEESSKEIKKIIDHVKERCGIYVDKSKYPKVALISKRLSEEEICSLHQSCDTFVTTSRGEGWCNPAIDAIAFGNRIIAPNNSAFKDYHLYCDDFGTLVDGTYTSAFGGDKNVPFGLYSSKESWFRCNIQEFGSAMLKYYKEKNTNKSNRSEKILESLSRKNIGNKIREIL